MIDSFLLLYDHHWNKDCNGIDNVIRVKNWKDIHKEVKNLKRFY